MVWEGGRERRIGSGGSEAVQPPTAQDLPVLVDAGRRAASAQLSSHFGPILDPALHQRAQLRLLVL